MGQKIVRMHRDFFVELWKEGERHYRVIEDALPEDTKIISISEDFFFSTNCIGIMFESSEWPDVPPGCAVPIIEPRFQTIFSPKSWRENPLL